MSTATHRHGFTCAETHEHVDYQGKHRDDTEVGQGIASVRDAIAKSLEVLRRPESYIGKHCTPVVLRERIAALPPRTPARYDQCDSTCTTDCGHCKGAGHPTAGATR